MFKTVRNAFKIKDIRKKLFFTFIALIIVRLGSQLPVPGINREYFQQWLGMQTSFGFLDTLTGGSFSQMSIFALGIGPYITASIIMQLLTIAIPKLEEMQKEGEDGRKKIQNYSRYLTVGLAVVESIALSISFGSSGILEAGSKVEMIIVITAAFTAGTAFLMWLGERITDRGVGNGISIILLINIVSGMPNDFRRLNDQFVAGASSILNAIIAVIIIVAVVSGMTIFIVLLQEGQRKVPVQYTKKVQGRKMVGGQSSHIPFKVNTAGVIPVIFASSIMQFPIVIASFFQHEPSRSGTLGQKILFLLNQNNWLNINGWDEFKYSIGLVVYVAFILFFSYFYTSITSNPLEIANNMKKQGGFIPGIRPGKPTAEYLSGVLNKIILIGAIGLIFIATVPIIFSGTFGAQVSFGGTSLIIVVGVVLETMKQIESQMLVRHYKGFLSD